MAERAALIVDGTPRTVIAISRSLAAKGIPVVVGHFGPISPALGSRSVRSSFALPSDPQELLAFLFTLFEQQSIGTLFAGNDVALNRLHPYHADLVRKVKVGFPPAAVLRRVLDKELSMALAQQCDVPVPNTFRIHQPDELRALPQSVSYPIIAKPSRAASGSAFKVQRFDDWQQLRPALLDGDYIRANIFQEYIEGDGVGITTLFHDDEPIAFFQHRRLHEWPAGGGVGVFMRAETLDDRLVQASTRLLKALRWDGPAMVEFRHDAITGRFAFLEINGRFAGSLPLVCKAGIDLPYWQWQSLNHRSIQVADSYPAGIRMRWTAGAVYRLCDVWSNADTRAQLKLTRVHALTQFIDSFAPGVHSALFAMSDLRPSVRDSGGALGFMLRTVLAATLKPFVPAEARRIFFQHQQLRSAERRAYRQMLWRRILRKDRRDAQAVREARNILFVCRGNRIRSPFAGALLRAQLSGSANSYRIESAGTRAVSSAGVDERILSLGVQNNLKIEDTPKRLTQEMIAATDLLIVMDRLIEAEVVAEFPQAVKKVALLSTLVANPAHVDVDDPDTFTSESFVRSMNELQDLVIALSQRLQKKTDA